MYTYQGHHNKLMVRELCALYFVEVSSGVYCIEKDRYDLFDVKYVSQKSVVKSLNKIDKVAIEKLDGTIVSNNFINR